MSKLHERTEASESVLLVIDVQDCFLTGGSLQVAGGEKVIPVINKLAPYFQNVVASQDAHHPHNVSFYTEHPGKKVFESIKLPNGQMQTLWPPHCIENKEEIRLHKDLKIIPQMLLRKGFQKDTDSYSAFKNADGERTGLRGYLRDRGIKNVFIVGLALSYCVAWTAKDAADEGFRVFVILDATETIELPAGITKIETKKMEEKNVSIITSAQFISSPLYGKTKPEDITTEKVTAASKVAARNAKPKAKPKPSASTKKVESKEPRKAAGAPAKTKQVKAEGFVRKSVRLQERKTTLNK